MEVLWTRRSATANEVVDELAGRTDWKPKTIHTLLRRLVNKRAVRFERQGREYVFHPIVDASDYAHQAGRGFLDRFFGGELAPFLASFLEREKLSTSEIRELRRLLDEKKS